MKPAILSDIHHNIWALAAALRHAEDVDALIYGGQLCSPFVVAQLAKGFPNQPIHIVFGSNGGNLFRIIGTGCICQSQVLLIGNHFV
jgi:predicted phosphodiesterase